HARLVPSEQAFRDLLPRGGEEIDRRDFREAPAQPAERAVGEPALLVTDPGRQVAEQRPRFVADLRIVRVASGVEEPDDLLVLEPVDESRLADGAFAAARGDL